MKIGVVMPTFNQEKWLPAALASYFQQTHRDSSLVIVDDGSTDGTSKILETLRSVRVVSLRSNVGTAEAINHGVNLLRRSRDVPDALTWISSDNTMMRDSLSKLAKVMVENTAGVVYAGFWYVKPENKAVFHYTSYDPNHLINNVNCFFGPAFLIRTDVWVEAGQHRGRISHDYDHWLRVEEVCWRWNLPIVGVAEPLCWYNAHDERVTVTRAHQFDAHEWQAVARARRAAYVASHPPSHS